MNKNIFYLSTIAFFTLLSFNTFANADSKSDTGLSVGERSFKAVISGLKSSDFSSYQKNVFHSPELFTALNVKYGKEREWVKTLAKARKNFSSLLTKLSKVSADGSDLEHNATLLMAKEDKDWPDSSYLVLIKKGEQYYSYDLNNCTDHQSETPVSCAHVGFFKTLDEKTKNLFLGLAKDMKQGKEQDCSKFCVIEAR